MEQEVFGSLEVQVGRLGCLLGCVSRVCRENARASQVPCMKDSPVLEEEEVLWKQVEPMVPFGGKTEEWLKKMMDHLCVETEIELRFHMFVQPVRKLKLFCSVQCLCLHFCPWSYRLAQGHL